MTPLLLGISIILLAAKFGGDLMMRVRQPAVLGELLVGVLLGNLVLFGFDGLEFLRPGTAHADAAAQAANGGLAAQTLDMLARIGVILLLFEVGLESNLHEMRKVGLSAFVVAVLGVVTPMGLVSAGKPVIDPPVYSAIVVMVMVTTLVTPPLLSWSLRRQRSF